MGNATEKKSLKIGIYDPYLHILGGAERYVMAIAACFPDAEVVWFTQKNELLNQGQIKFGIKFPVSLVQAWPQNRNVRLAKLRSLDMFFYITDGSLFYSPAKNNILIIQSPAHIPKPGFVTQLKLFTWKKIICYSEFMANIISARLGKRPDVLFVPITKHQSRKPKKNWIVTVGRFFSHLHNKKQLEMIQAFTRLIKTEKNIKLFIIGSIDPGGEEYFLKVRTAAADLPIEIHTDFTYSQLQSLYAQAKIYWHAAGFGENLIENPERAEHFGVVTIEAMSHGTVPVVFAGGGQTEIVTNGTNGFTWNSEEELLKYTKELIHNDSLWDKMSKSAYESSLTYNQVAFIDKLHEIISK